jgi:SAM-dependent methyltransferase
MSTENDYFKGYAPEVKVTAGNPEAQKYGKMWEHPEYREVSPGQRWAPVFLANAKPSARASVLDIGCGTGRGGLLLAAMGQLNVTLIDFVRNCLDAEVRELTEQQPNSIRFVKADIEKPLPVVAEYGFCCDVMEHIPPDKIDVVLDNILKAAQHVFFSIAMYEDSCGSLIDEDLHLSVHPYSWWLEKFNSRDCVIHWSEEQPGQCLFYVSAWQDGQKVVDSGVLNSGEETVKANVKHNTSQRWQQVQPHETNDLECMILGGGPSLAGFEDEIKQKRAEGVKLITLNGTYNWAINHGLTPSAQIMVDARPFNARFTKPVVDDCKYLIASQCDPSVLEGLPHERTYLWHTSTDLIKDILDKAYDHWWAIPGGSTVLLRAIPLMRMLGYRKFHLYGCDSCIVNDQHHAYAQPENDSELILPVIVNPGGRAFKCHPWQASQAQEMLALIKYLGHEIELAIYGDGLLAHILNVGANEADIQQAYSMRGDSP